MVQIQQTISAVQIIQIKLDMKIKKMSILFIFQQINVDSKAEKEMNTLW